MSNNIQLAERYAPELDKEIMQSAKTGFFADSKFKAMFTGAKTVKLPVLSLDGLGDYNRASGYSKGDVALTYKDYTLAMERSKQLVIDAQDADESGVGNLVGQTVGEFTRLKVTPEIDSYVISTIYGIATQKGNVKAFAEENAVELMLEQINAAEAAVGYSGEQMIAFVDPVMYAALMTSEKIQRNIVTSDFKQGEVNMKVKSLNGVSIIPMDPRRMKKEYERTENGLSPKDGTPTINAVILPKRAASLVKKVDKVDVYSPDVVQDMDAYKVNFRLYYDLFVTEQNKGLIFGIGG